MLKMKMMMRIMMAKMIIYEDNDGEDDNDDEDNYDEDDN